MPALRLGDLELSYELRGEGEPLVFLHGLGSSTRDWEAQLDHFSARYRCVAFDLPGNGRSIDHAHPRGPFSIPGFAAAVASGLAALELPPAHVVGLSLGGMTALQLGLDAPARVASLTVVNAAASVIPRNLKERLLIGLRRVVTNTLGPPGVAKLVAPRLFPKPEQAPLREQFIAQVSALDARTYAAVSAAIFGWTVESRVAELRCPVALITADGDYTPVAVKHALAAKIAGAEVIVVADSHHALPMELPLEFNRVLDTVLAKRSLPGSSV